VWLSGLSLEECQLAAIPDTVTVRLISDHSSSGDVTQREQRTHRDISSVLSVLSVSQAVEIAIRATLPFAPGQRHRKVFELARHLKSITELRDVDPRSLRSIVERWHKLALPVIRTKAFEESWFDFLAGFDQVKFRVGEQPIELLYAQ